MQVFQDAVIAALAVVIILVLVSTTIVVYSIDRLGDRIDYATIAGTTVPAVHCQEDEVIWWTGPDALGCVHYEEVK
jgi:hypothetical protein